MADRPRRLCIVSSDRLRSGDFIEALRASLHPQDHIQIIMDRRRERSSRTSGLEERRQHPGADLELQANGFAIVPAFVDPEEPPTAPPIDPLFSKDDEEDQRLIESVRQFKRPRSGGLIPKLLGVLIGVALAMVVLAPAWPDLGTSLVGLIPQGAPSGGQTTARPETQLPPTGPPTAQTDALASTGPKPLRDADRLIATPRQASAPLTGLGTTAREPGTPSPATGRSSKEASAAPNAATVQADSGRPTPGATAQSRPSAPPRPKPIASTSPPEPETSVSLPPRSVEAHRAELAREPVSVGWGQSYAVRILDSAGEPVAGVDVSLVALMADGTLASIPMGALPETGTYRATVPTDRSAPVDVWVRVTAGDRHVEIPVRR